MDAAEEIVTKWLNNQGYFTINNLKMGNGKEIDILAFSPSIEKGPKAIHVEVQVSTRPVKGSDVSPETVTKYCDRKFIHENSNNNDERIKKEVFRIFGHQNYEKWLVKGVIDEVQRNDYVSSLEKNDVKLLNISDIVNDLVKEMDGVDMQNPIRYLQIIEIKRQNNG